MSACLWAGDTPSLSPCPPVRTQSEIKIYQLRGASLDGQKKYMMRCQPYVTLLFQTNHAHSNDLGFFSLWPFLSISSYSCPPSLLDMCVILFPVDKALGSQGNRLNIGTYKNLRTAFGWAQLGSKWLGIGWYFPLFKISRSTQNSTRRQPIWLPGGEKGKVRYHQEDTQGWANGK